MSFSQYHLLGIEPLDPQEIVAVLDLADSYADLNREARSTPTRWPG